MKNTGFSLVELITVMAILGILLGIAGIFGYDWLERYRVEGQTKELYADLMNTRVRALQRNRVFIVDLQAANQYAIYEDTNPSPDGDGDLQPMEDTLVSQKPTRFPLQHHLGGFGPRMFKFEQNGLVSRNGSIRFDSSVDPFSDCIVLFSTRILMGKWNSLTSKCVAQ